jgi:hypothetical protein
VVSEGDTGTVDEQGRLLMFGRKTINIAIEQYRGTSSFGELVGDGFSDAAGSASDDRGAWCEGVVLHDAAVFLSCFTAVRLLWFRKSSTTVANSSACSICGM